MPDALPELDLAWTLLQQQRFAEAAAQAQQVLGRHPGNISALACHAMANWKAEGDIATSIAEMQRAVAAAPAEASLRHNLATLLASSGDVAGAAGQFREALRIKPDDTLAFYGLTQNMKFREAVEPVPAMVALAADPGLGAGRREMLLFGLAKVFDDLGSPEKAMEYALEANRLGARPFEWGGETRSLEELQELARLDGFSRMRTSGHPSRAPLFIVGMPRSGTTLVEAILARHPEVLALGESNQIRDAEVAAYLRRPVASRNVGRQQLMLELDRDWLAARAEEMAGRWAARARAPFAVATDKLPENAVRLGLIKRLFPNARVIHVRRHPLDTGVSNFFQRFAAGQGYSTRLDWIGARTRQVADSMEIWKRSLDLPILDVSYERLVADPEPQSRRIVAFAGLAWTDACLSPEQATHSILTASQWQVRQPINTASVARWQRYAPWLGPMIEAMGGMEWIETEVADIAARG
ncbi:MAG TPA: sulfotransferase [Devosia sp.]|nr:sulfotransferase [Devosia sp.]